MTPPLLIRTMFSRREREFLELVVRSETTTKVWEERFPNPAYRRRLRWGIRQKAARAASDWDLYLRAAQCDARVLVRSMEPRSGEIPVVTEPFARLMRALLPRRDRGARAAPTRRSPP